MSNNEKKGSLYDSGLASLPWLLFAVTQYFTSAFYAIALAVAVWGACMFYYVKTKYNKIFLIRVKVYGTVLFALTACLVLLPVCENHIILLAEVILFFVFWFLYISKTAVRKKYLKKSTPENVSELSVSLSELFFIAGMYMNILLLHFFIAFLYLILLEEYHSTWKDQFIYNKLGIIFILLMACYGYVRTHIIRKKLKKEIWLPVVNRCGDVIGKVAKSVSCRSGNQYLHPTVRIALVYKGQLCIKEKTAHDMPDFSKYDHPFERPVYYRQTLLEAVGAALQAVPGAMPAPRPIFKYLHETEKAKRLIHLYALPVQGEETMSLFKSIHGRTWTEKQIEENLGKNVFSECFEKEYELLKNTVLVAEKIVAKRFGG
jgi:hypothetical protein